MIDCLNVARYFIVRAYEDSIEAEMTNMKVQKLLYYAQNLHLAMYDEPLFEEEIQAWRYGPVCPLPIPSQEFLLEMPKDKRQLLEEV
ncbi:MAG: type II toxin-antitoxin system antitoxin SocA domain-containing protein [Nostoc sp.]|uniref:Panacea domain-containing protein n=1 Tax=Nostoc sp. TaxID=1180 RepID=UPI002FFA9BE4